MSQLLHLQFIKCIWEKNRSKVERSMEEHPGKEIFKQPKSLQPRKNHHRIIYWSTKREKYPENSQERISM